MLAPAAGNTVASLTPVPATAIAANAAVVAAHEAAAKAREAALASTAVVGHVSPSIAHMNAETLEFAKANAAAHAATGVVAGAAVSSTPTAAEIAEFEAKFNAAAAEHAATAPDEDDSELDARVAAIEARLADFNKRSGQKI